MGYSDKAVQKGMTSEYLAKAYYSNKGYTIIQPDSHESHYDFIIEKNGELLKVQVKSVAFCFHKSGGDEGHGLKRVRNKRGQNGSYPVGAYDILTAVDPYEMQIYEFIGEQVLGEGMTESITLSRTDGKPLLVKKGQESPQPFYSGPVLERVHFTTRKEYLSIKAKEMKN